MFIANTVSSTIMPATAAMSSFIYRVIRKAWDGFVESRQAKADHEVTLFLLRTEYRNSTYDEVLRMVRKREIGK